MRWDCAYTGAEFSGYWVAPGKVRRVPSPLELVLQTSKPVVFNDIEDPKQTAADIEKAIG
jgi:hypothetical protein